MAKVYLLFAVYACDRELIGVFSSKKNALKAENDFSGGVKINLCAEQPEKYSIEEAFVDKVFNGSHREFM